MPFRLEVPNDVQAIHVRRVTEKGSIFLCSTDAKFKYAVKATDELPFDKLANDSRYVFLRNGNVWHQECRDPRVGFEKR